MIHVKIILISSFVTAGSMQNLNDRPPFGKDHKFSPFTTNAGAERRKSNSQNVYLSSLKTKMILFFWLFGGDVYIDKVHLPSPSMRGDTSLDVI